MKLLTISLILLLVVLIVLVVVFCFNVVNKEYKGLIVKFNNLDNINNYIY